MSIMSEFGRRLVTLISMLVALHVWQAQAHAATITVGNTADSGPGSLREALERAADGDTIRITARGVITLTTGELVVNKRLEIIGPGSTKLRISGNNASRLFRITPGAVVTIAALSITDGRATVGAFPNNVGGGVFSDHARLTLRECIVSGNSARYGGGVFSNSRDGGSADLTLSNTMVRGNSARFFGGGIFSGGGVFGAGDSGVATLTVRDSRVSDNSAGFGGGIFNDGFFGRAAATIINSSVSNNLVRSNGVVAGGGGIYNNGDSGVATLALTNSTLSGNVAGVFVLDPGEEHPFEPGSGGGIYNDGLATSRPGIAQVTLDNTTISGNRTHANGGDGGRGSGILNEARNLGRASVTANFSNIDENSAEEGGGGIYNISVAGEATVTLTGSTVNANATNFGTSGIFNQGMGSEEDADMLGIADLTLSNTAVRLNSGGFEAVSSLIGVNPGGRANLNITGCDISDNLGGGIVIGGQGGIASTTISDSMISRNRSELEGGGILNFANQGSSTLRITGSIISQNYGRSGGGIANISNNSGPATLIIDKSTVSDNHATAATGGGILNDSFGQSATVTISNSTLSGNSADGDFTIAGYGFGGGGGVLNVQRSGGVGTVDLTNCTLSGNSTDYAGGAIANYADTGQLMPRITLDNCTLNDNSAAQGGNSVWNKSAIDDEPCTEPGCSDPLPGAAKVDFANTIFNSGALGENIQNIGPGMITSRGYNLSSDRAGGDGLTGPGGFLNAIGDIRNTDPRFGPLQDNGGPTRTHALLINSPAINAGDPNFNPFAFNPPMLYDQRSGPGFIRVVNGRIDIGSFEARHP